ncbi:probable tyrosyl-DNA phosphodiesterase isoform X2 [Hermetia illucens]|nr:probable tyrosyl-DNA phosphodiesterase isoform X2 [Hermetia illucens]XP_037921102.1 probable tyrosyl-DNA phosphodiesterase isoform X2 [Hermetia illucens]XP_037921104.1 probable tyrosyl-DNA phosphodiesterase isoform X2 [Hermetia illucens]
MEQLLILEKLNLNDANRPRKVSDEDSIKQQPKENEDLSKQTSAEQNEARNPLPGPSASASTSVSSTDDSDTDDDHVAVVLPKGQIAKKLEEAAPYNFFLTTITDSKPTHNEPLSITLQEILDESLGELESSVQMSFIVDIRWLLKHYSLAGWSDTPLLLLHGDGDPQLQTISQKEPQVTAVEVRAISLHHTKMMLLGYKDGSMRVVVSTANLYWEDWHNRTQGLWISRTLKPLPENAATDNGESPTGFRNDLILYLIQYKISRLQPWIKRIRKTDFSSVNVFLVASIPGKFHETRQRDSWGHTRLGSLLSKHCPQIDETCPVIAQSSSMGNMGRTVQNWIYNDFVSSASRDMGRVGIRRLPPFQMIYPSLENVKNSHDGMLGADCLSYTKKNNEKQPWLKAYLYQWKAKGRHREHAMPHIKTYFRYSERGLHWFVLTSSNLSRSAWGAFYRQVRTGLELSIYNYEAGVLFLPKFVIGKDVFPLDKAKDGDPPFPMPHDLPPTPYAPEDIPFVIDFLSN